MPAHRVEITVSEETWDRLEAARGFEARASFVKRALESALGEPGDQPPGREVGGLPVQPGAAPSSAPSRASAKKPAASGELPKIAKRHWA